MKIIKKTCRRSIYDYQTNIPLHYHQEFIYYDLALVCRRDENEYRKYRGFDIATKVKTIHIKKQLLKYYQFEGTGLFTHNYFQICLKI